jgi:hypothetical protein
LEWILIWIFQFINNLVSWPIHIFELQKSILNNECIIFKKYLYLYVHNHHVNVLPIVSWQIQNYVIHHKHLNVMQLVGITIVTQPCIHPSLNLGSLWQEQESHMGKKKMLKVVSLTIQFFITILKFFANNAIHRDWQQIHLLLQPSSF